MEHSLENQELRDWYRERGFGGRVGFGQRPALLVIDLARGWLDPSATLGSEQAEMLDSVMSILETARETEIPIIFTTMGGLTREADEVHFLKLPEATLDVINPELMKLDPALERREDELLLVKPRQSAFFATSLLNQLIGLRADTVVVIGVSTSGCVRSTCEDAFNHNFHVIVPKEAVGDRCESAHEAALFDIDNRFGDVMTADEVEAQLAKRRTPVPAAG